MSKEDAKKINLMLALLRKLIDQLTLDRDGFMKTRFKTKMSPVQRNPTMQEI